MGKIGLHWILSTYYKYSIYWQHTLIWHFDSTCSCSWPSHNIPACTEYFYQNLVYKVLSFTVYKFSFGHRVFS